MTKIFNPKDWLEVPKEQPQPKSNTATTNVVAVVLHVQICTQKYSHVRCRAVA